MKVIYNMNCSLSLVFLIFCLLLNSNLRGQGIAQDGLSSSTKEGQTNVGNQAMVSNEPLNAEVNYQLVTGSLIKLSAAASNEVIIYEKSPNIEGFPKYINTGNLDLDIKNYNIKKSNWVSQFKPDLETAVKNEIKIPMTIKKNIYRNRK